MALPVEITFRNAPTLPAAEARIRDKAAKLEKLFPKVISCKVIVDSPHRQHQTSNTYDVTVDLTVPDNKVIVHSSGSMTGPTDVFSAINLSFEKASRQLHDYAKRRRHE